MFDGNGRNCSCACERCAIAFMNNKFSGILGKNERL